MSYVRETLIGDETIKAEAKISIWSMLPTFIVSGFLSLLALVMLVAAPPLGLLLFLFAAVPLGIAYLRYVTTELAVTDRRVIAKFGFIRRSTIEIGLSKIESVQVHQGILGRLFNYGSLILAGSGNPQAPIPGIERPMEFRRVAMELVSNSSSK
jgi:uncharacterized membrane protein YdbT with pleckstrin-like domain